MRGMEASIILGCETIVSKTGVAAQRAPLHLADRVEGADIALQLVLGLL